MSFRSVIAAALGFVVLAVLMTWPLAAHLSDALPGPPGDNTAFLWNFWWMRKALATGASPFWTSYLFAPYGIDLTLNTHTALPAFIGATVLSPLNVVAAQNVMTIATLALNGFAAFWLARAFTHDDGAAFAGGVIFAMSAYISAHLLGHFNLISAYVLPLFVLFWMRTCRGSRYSAIAAGLVLAATAFIDYYYLVYELMIAALVLIVEASVWSFTRRTQGSAARVLSWMLGFTAVVVGAAIVLIWTTGGFEFEVGGRHVSMHSTYNPRQIFWVLLGAWIAVRWWPRTRVQWRAGWPARQAAQTIAMAAVVFLVLASPIIWHGWRLIVSGDYVSQRYFWRSAPSGVDLVTFALGNPLHPLWGRAVLNIYDHFHLSQLESLGWLGVVPMWLATRTIRRESSRIAVQLWLVVGGCFLIMALGSHLRVFGMDTGMILPQTLLRYLPIVSNARMPARGMVVVSLAAAMLSAIAVARLRERSRRPALIPMLIVALVVADNITAPYQMLLLDRPSIYSTLRERSEPGALCELPVGIQDGFGVTGSYEPRALFYQTIHERPIVGGATSRLPPSVRAGYEHDPVLNVLFQLSDWRQPDVSTLALPTRDQTIAGLQANGVSFVMLDRQLARGELRAFVERLQLTEIARDRRRTLYRVAEAP